MRSPIHNVGSWSARWARTSPERLAVADEHRRLDCAAFEERVSRAAGWLAQHGIRPGERVALLLGNHSTTLELVLAAARVGAISVPMNTRLSAREIAFQIDDCRPRVVCCAANGELRAVLEAALASAAHVPAAVAVIEPDSDGAYERECAAAPAVAPAAVDPDDPMMILYTSGTTGAPKGALLPHRKTLANALNAQLYFGIRPGEDSVLVTVPLFHSLGLYILSLPALYAGASVILHSHFDADAFWQAVAAEGITYAGGVPTQYRRLLDRIDPARPEARRSLRFLFTAGAAISADTVRAYEARGLVLKQGYGQTETSTLCCLDERDALRKAGSVGRPVFHADLRIVDPESCTGEPDAWRTLAPGETGEIVVRGPITMLGYWERPQESAATLRGEWLRTGDLASLDDEGFVTLVGRARDMYISGGENVYPAEVEAVLSEHPHVREVAVVGVPDPDWGETGRAHIVPEPGCRLELDGLHDWARTRLARFKLPHALVIEEALPRTASGKVEKYRLVDRTPR